jgi:AraC-like DNA-binding protein
MTNTTGPERPCLHVKANHQHGNRATYVLDQCRCRPCRHANRDAERTRQRIKLYGRPTGWTDATPVREHVEKLSAAGMGVKTIAAEAGLYNSQLTRIIYGRAGADPAMRRPPCTRIRTDTAEAILAVQLRLAPGAITDPTGTVRRLQALVAIGWSQNQLGARLGMLGGNFGKLVAGRRQVTVRTRDAVVELYDQLWDQKPDTSTRPLLIAYNRSRNYAAGHGWPPPLAWDDDTIDDPTAGPGDVLADTDPRISEVEFLLSTGADPDEIARRLGMKRTSLMSILRIRLDRPDLAQRLNRSAA